MELEWRFRRRQRAAILTAVALAVALAGCGPAANSQQPSATGTIAGTPGPSATAAASPSAAAASPIPTATPPTAAVWRRLSLPNSADVRSLADVAARPGEVVMVGNAGPAGERGIAWTSTDGGRTWARERLPGPGGPGRVVSWGERALVAGFGQGANCAHPSVVRVWPREVAGTWIAAPFDPIFCAGGTPTVAVLGDQAVIAGVGSGDVGYVWSSDDGRRWADRSAAFADRLPRGVTADGGGFVAVGTSPAIADVWVARSADGTTWAGFETLPGLPVGASVQEPVSVGGVVAIFVGDSSGTMSVYRPDPSGGWRSTLVDGLDGGDLSRMVAVEGGLVALGGDARGPAAWASSDGSAWRPVDLPADAVAAGSGATLTGAAIEGGRAYLAGQLSAANGGGATGAAWEGPSSLLAP